MEFKKELEKYQDIVNRELEKYLRKQDCPERILNESMEYSLMAGGKRIRPTLILATYNLFSQNYDICLPYVVAAEMVHNFSLIHDDLPGIDNDDFRHGKLTNHKKYNEATAILAGDGLLNNAYMVISNDLCNTLEQEKLTKKLRVYNEFAIMIDRMIAGEYVDTEFEGRPISSEYLEYMHENKTAAFIKYSVRTGAILAGAKEEDIDKLTIFAEKIGLAFQIKDDILSEEGNELITGKPVGNDRSRNKCTYVTKYGIEEAKKILENITNEAVNIISEYGEKTEFLKKLAIYIKDRNK